MIMNRVTFVTCIVPSFLTKVVSRVETIYGKFKLILLKILVLFTELLCPTMFIFLIKIWLGTLIKGKKVLLRVTDKTYSYIFDYIFIYLCILIFK